MANMFYACHKLKEIKGINNFNTIKVIDMSCQGIRIFRFI